MKSQKIESELKLPNHKTAVAFLREQEDAVYKFMKWKCKPEEMQTIKEGIGMLLRGRFSGVNTFIDRAGLNIYEFALVLRKCHEKVPPREIENRMCSNEWHALRAEVMKIQLATEVFVHQERLPMVFEQYILKNMPVEVSLTSSAMGESQ